MWEWRAINSMKKITLANDMVQLIVSKVEAFRTDKNRIQLDIGISNLGDGMLCRATLINGGMMAQVGFKTCDVPKDCGDISKDSPYFTVCVKASQFCNYMKAFLAFDSDISLEYDEKSSLMFKVGTQATVVLDVSNEMDALLPTSLNNILAKVKVTTKNILNTLRVGGFMAANDVDERGLTDRVALKFTDTCITAYSTDGYIMSKAWCECTSSFNNPVRCARFLTKKLEELEGASKAEFGKKINAVKTSAAEVVALAVEEGYVEGPLFITLPTASTGVLRSVFSGTEELLISVSDKHLMVQAANVLATFCIGEKVSEVYARNVDPWEKTAWTSMVAVDKETFVNALSIIKLSFFSESGKRTALPFHVSSKGEKLIVKDSKANVVSLPLVSNSGDLSKIGIYLDVEKTINILSKLPNGNVVVRFFVAPNGKSAFPVCLSNGDLNGNGTSSYTYLLPVNKATAEAATSDEEQVVKKEDVAQTEQPASEVATEPSENVCDNEIPDLPEVSMDDLTS